MDNTLLLVQVLQRLGYLCDDMPGQVLAEVGQADDLMEQFSSGCELQDDIIVLLRLGEVNEFHDAGVVQLPHYLDFL